MIYRTICIPPASVDPTTITDAWGAPALSVVWDPAAGTLTVDTDAYPDGWPGSQGDPAGAWALLYSGPVEPAP